MQVTAALTDRVVTTLRETPEEMEVVQMSKDTNPDAGFGDEDEAVEQAQLSLLSEAFPEIREVSPEAVQTRMQNRVRKATTLDELFDSLQGNSSDALVGKSFEFTAIEWQPYQSEKGIIPQAVCTAIDLSTGEETEFVTTGFMLVNFLRQAQVMNMLPFKARIVEKTTKRGQKALNFERA